MGSEDHNNVYALLHAVAQGQGVQAHGSKKLIFSLIDVSKIC
jgi:hypothetical protein